MILLLLLSLVACATAAGGTTVFIDKEFTPQTVVEPISVKVKHSQLGYLRLQGYGEVKVKIESSSHQLSSSITCHVFLERICLLWNSDDRVYSDSEEIDVSIESRLYSMGDISRLRLELVGGAAMELDVGESLLVALNDVGNLDLIVSLRKIDTRIDPKKAKIQFFVKQTFNSYLNSNEYVKLFVDLGSNRLNSSQTPSHASTSSIGIGTVVTLLPSDDIFCFNTSCRYAIRIETMKVQLIEVDVQAFDRETPVSIVDGVMLLDQLRDDDNATYIFNSVDDGSRYNWRFDMMAVEGNADMSVNADSMPQRLADYRWKSTEAGNEAILVTAKQIQQLNLTAKTFYVHTHASQQATFWMAISKRLPSSIERILPNTPITGEAHHNEIINYHFNADVRIPEKLSVFVSLKSLTGNPDLYVKDCGNEASSCIITQHDIDAAASLASNSSLLFKYSASPSDDDALQLDFACVPADPKYKDFDFPADSNLKKYFRSKNCQLAVAVVGHTSATSSVSRYRLEVKGARFHRSIVAGELTSLRIDQYQSIFFVLDIDRSIMINNTHLNIRFIIISGDVDIFISRTTPYPDENNFDRDIKIDNDNKQLFSLTRHATFKGTPDQLKGKYYISLTARQFVFGSILVSASNDDAEATMIENDLEIFPGSSVYGTVQADPSAQKNYYFNLDLPDTQHDLEMILQLVPIEGKFRYCLSSEVAHVDSWDKCTWKDETANGNIILSQKDPQFKRRGIYGILVEPDLSEKSEAKEFSYSLSLSSQDSIMEITEGVPSKMTVLKSAKIFRLPVSSTSNQTVLMITTLDSKAQLETTIDRTDFYNASKTIKPYLRTSIGTEAAISYMQRDIDAQCENLSLRADGIEPICWLYIRIKPSNFMPFEYTLLAFADDKPTVILEGTTTSLPAPLKNEIILQYSPLNSNKGITINVYSEYYTLMMVATVYSMTTDMYLNHTSYTVNDIGTNVVFIPDTVLQAATSPMVKIRLINDDFSKHPENYPSIATDVDRRIMVQVSRGIRRLSHMVPIEEDKALTGTFKFYKFTKPRESEALIFLRVLKGEADLYVRRGEDKFPDLDTFDFRSNTIKNDEIMLPVSTQISVSDPLESFIIGVYAREPSSFKIIATKNSSFSYLSISDGDIISRDVQPDRPLILSYYNQHNSPFVFGIYSSTSKMSVYYKAYDESVSEDFFDEIPTTQNKLSAKSVGFFDRFTIQPLLGDTKRKQYLFKLEASRPTSVLVFAGAKEAHLSIRGGEIYGDTVDKDACNSYIASYDSAVLEEEVVLKVDAGEVSFKLSHTDMQNATFSKTGIQAPATITKKARDIFAGQAHALDSFPIYKDFIIELCGTTQASYHLSTSTPSVILTKLNPSTRFDLHLNNTKKLYYYKSSTKYVKTLRLRINLEQNPNHPTAMTDLNMIKQNLEFFYVTKTEDVGYEEKKVKNVLQDLSVPAHIINETSLEEAGRKQVVMTFSVMDGLFLIRPKSTSPTQDVVRMQLIVNDFKDLSVLGSNIEEIESGKIYTYQMMRPKDTVLDLIFSSCLGKFEVNIFDGEDNMKSIHSFTIGRDFDLNSNVPKILEEMSKPVNTRLRIHASLIIITVKKFDTAQDYQGFINIQADFSSKNDSLALSDYFFAYMPYATSLVRPAFYTLDMKPDTFDIHIKPIVPAKGGEEKFKQFKSATIEYTVIASTRTISRFHTDSTCSIRNDRLSKDASTTYFIHATNNNIVNGTLVWQASDVDIKDINYPKGEPPFYGLLEVKMVFKGEFDDSSDDDAVVILKDSFTLDHTGVIEVAADHLVSIILITVAVCLVILLCTLYKKYKQSKEVVREKAPTSANDSSQMDDANKIEITEMRTNTAATNDDTL